MVVWSNNCVGKYFILILICYNIEFLFYMCKKESVFWGLCFYFFDYFVFWVFFI